MKRWMTALVLGCAMNLSTASPRPASVRAEIEQLLHTLSHSDCEFYRNGSWYPGSQAASHLRHKLDYFERKGLIDDASGFIAAAATRSSMSGEAYRVRCPGRPAEPSADWLNRTLERNRAEAAVRGH